MHFQGLAGACPGGAVSPKQQPCRSIGNARPCFSAATAHPSLQGFVWPDNPPMQPSQEPDRDAALPDRLSTDPASPHHVQALMGRDIGVRFNGRERHDVEEYCISEGWIRVPAGKTLDRKGHPLLIKLKGKVEAFYR